MTRTGPTRRAAGAAVASLVALLAWLLALVHFRNWIATNDFAILRVSLEQELRGHIPAVGAFSRLGVFHPGPLREWVFVVPYWVSGRRAAALPATALIVNLGWVWWTWAISRRRASGPERSACVIGLLVVVIALGPNLASPWNPHLAILPLYLAAWAAVFVVTDVAAGRADHRGSTATAAIVSASWAAQMHASALILGVVLAATVLVALLIGHATRMFVAACGLALVLWSGPILDLRHGTDANVIAMMRVGSSGDSVGLAGAFGSVSRLLWPFTPLSGRSVRPSAVALGGFTPVWLLLVIVVLVAGARHRDRLRAAIALGAVAVTTLTISLFVQPDFRYLYGPLQAAAVFALAVAAVPVLAATERTGSARASSIVVPAVLAAILLVFVVVPADDPDTPGRRALAVEPAVVRVLREHPDWSRVEVVGAGLAGASIDAEIVDVALRYGIDVRSRRFGLAVPPPTGTEPMLVAAMGEPRACLTESLPVADQVLDGVVATVDLPVTIFVVDRSTPASRCLPADVS